MSKLKKAKRNAGHASMAMPPPPPPRTLRRQQLIEEEMAEAMKQKNFMKVAELSAELARRQSADSEEGKAPATSSAACIAA